MDKIEKLPIQYMPPEGGIFLHEHLNRQNDVTNSIIWYASNHTFLKNFINLIPERTVTICQYGVGVDGGLIDLSDIKEQLAHEWLGIMTLRFRNHSDPSCRIWILRAAESYYKGFYEYGIPVQYENLTVCERYYNPQGMTANVNTTNGEIVLPWVIEMLAHKNTLEHAETIQSADLRYK